jgi:hypothetical protein
MHARFLKYVPVLLFSASLATTACGDSDRTSPTAATPLQSALVAAEPMAVTAELVPNASCSSLPPFRIPLVIIVSGGQGLIVRGVRFSFTDRLGGTALPVVIPALLPSGAMSGSSSMPVPMPSSMPIPMPAPGSITLPGSSPIPIPGSTAVTGVLIRAGDSRRVPLILEFDCGVPAAGTLVATVETMSPKGKSDTSRVSVRVGS